MRRKAPLTGFTKSKVVRLRWCEEVTLNPGVGGIASHYFHANGMYHPNITGGGTHDPLGFDQMMAGYDHYTVIGSKIKVTPVNSSNGTGIPGYYGVILDDNGTFTYTTSAQVIESKQGKTAIALSQKSINGNQQSAYRSFSAKKFFHKSSIVMAGTYRGSATTNPTEQAYFGLWLGSTAGNDPNATAFMVEIEYIAVLTEPKFLAQS